MADPITAGIYAGAALGNYLSSKNAKKAASVASAENERYMQMQFNYQSQLQTAQQEWEERMSNTAHQREMADLKAAGLNPLLTATGGQGASTPTSGMGNIGLPDSTSATNARLQQTQNLKDFINLAIQNKMVSAQEEKLIQEALTEKNRRENLDADTLLKQLNSKEMEINIQYLPKQKQEELKKLRAEIFANIAESRLKNAMAETQPSVISANEAKAEKDKAEAENAKNLEPMVKALGAVGAFVIPLLGLKKGKLPQKIISQQKLIKPAQNTLGLK